MDSLGKTSVWPVLLLTAALAAQSESLSGLKAKYKAARTTEDRIGVLEQIGGLPTSASGVSALAITDAVPPRSRLEESLKKLEREAGVYRAGLRAFANKHGLEKPPDDSRPMAQWRQWLAKESAKLPASLAE